MISREAGRAASCLRRHSEQQIQVLLPCASGRRGRCWLKFEVEGGRLLELRKSRMHHCGGCNDQHPTTPQADILRAVCGVVRETSHARDRHTNSPRRKRFYLASQLRIGSQMICSSLTCHSHSTTDMHRAVTLCIIWQPKCSIYFYIQFSLPSTIPLLEIPSYCCITI
jgi:hypothetical protein